MLSHRFGKGHSLLYAGFYKHSNKHSPDRPGLCFSGQNWWFLLDLDNAFAVTEQWGIDGPPGGWQSCEGDPLRMVGCTLCECRADPDRVHMTGPAGDADAGLLPNSRRKS